MSWLSLFLGAFGFVGAIVNTCGYMLAAQRAYPQLPGWCLPLAFFTGMAAMACALLCLTGAARLLGCSPEARKVGP